MQSNIRYKLTDDQGQTHGQTKWGPETSYTTSGQGELCGPGWLHCYSDPVLAMFMNPSHANFKSPKLAEVNCSGQTKTDRGLKEGWTTMAFSRWLPAPSITTTQRVAFAILCTKQVYHKPAWTAWADKWLSGVDRTRAAADSAAYAAVYTAGADAAAYAAYAAGAAAAADAALAAAAAAAAAAADAAAAELNLVEIAHQALEYK